MRKAIRPATILFMIGFVYAATCTAQGHVRFDEWGKVTMDELKMKECSFEKGADAMLLIERARADFSKKNSNGRLAIGRLYVTTAYYRRYKIFSEKGKGRADIIRRLDMGSEEEIKNVHAVSYNLVGGEIKKTELNPSDVHVRKTEGNESEVSFSVPDVGVGTVFEVSYEREQVVTYLLPKWSFTADLPTARSSITVGFLDVLDYYVDRHILQDSLVERSETFTSEIELTWRGQDIPKALSGTAVTYTLNNIHSYEREPYTNSGSNFSNWIGFQLRSVRYPLNDPTDVVHKMDVIDGFKTYSKIKQNDVRFSAAINGPGIPKKLYKPLVPDSMPPEQRARVVFDFIRSNLKWNGYMGTTPYSTNGQVWKDKTGSMSEINLLLINTLMGANIKVDPMIVISRSNGYINENYPILEQYVGVDALVDFGGGNYMVLDATEKYLPFGVPAFDQLNTSGLVLREPDGYLWYNIRDKAGDKESVLIKGEMDESGHLTGEIAIVNNNYTAQKLIGYKVGEKGGALKNWVKSQVPSATIESINDSMDEPACRYFTRIKFSAQAPTDNEGNVYLSVDAIFGDATNPFVHPERSSDVDFGYRRRSDVVMQIRIPGSYVPDSVMPAMALTMQDTSIVFRKNAEVTDGTVTITQKLDLRKSFYPFEGYSSVYEFFQKYYSLKQKPVVLKKKA